MQRTWWICSITLERRVSDYFISYVLLLRCIIDFVQVSKHHDGIAIVGSPLCNGVLASNNSPSSTRRTLQTATQSSSDPNATSFMKSSQPQLPNIHPSAVEHTSPSPNGSIPTMRPMVWVIRTMVSWATKLMVHLSSNELLGRED